MEFYSNNLTMKHFKCICLLSLCNYLPSDHARLSSRTLRAQVPLRKGTKCHLSNTVRSKCTSNTGNHFYEHLTTHKHFQVVPLLPLASTFSLVRLSVQGIFPAFCVAFSRCCVMMCVTDSLLFHL